MSTPSDDRMAMAKAYQRATRGVTIALGMVVPGLIGHLIDRRLGTQALMTIIGFGIGMTFGIWELVRLSRPHTRVDAAVDGDNGQSPGAPDRSTDRSQDKPTA